MQRLRPEVLAPAGDADSLDAAIRAGADAVYFGLSGFNARARATNFDVASLSATMQKLHEHAVRGYVTLNTLVFDDELPALENAVRACAAAGADAVIVQDLGVLRLVREIAPDMPVHASTQMTCTDAKSVQFATNLGASRVILARELSVTDIASIKRDTTAELEAFVHGALCVSYSGQCLTSEAIGGRSANRGACAQACRLPYDLVVDGKHRELGDIAYLLSPEDLEASALVPDLAAAGVVSLKIEGRLKGPAYVAATTALYREAAVGAASEETRKTALATYTRGSGPGFLAGVDHQRLVDGRTCDHRGLPVGTTRGAAAGHKRGSIEIELTDALARGDGILVEGGREGAGEIGGRVWSIEASGRDVPRAEAGTRVSVWLGPDKRVGDAREGSRVFRTDDPTRERAARERAASSKVRVRFELRGTIGEEARLVAIAENGARAEVTLDAKTEVAKNTADRSASDEHPQKQAFREKLERLGDSPYELAELAIDLPSGSFIPPSSLNRARRAIVSALSLRRAHRTTDVTAATVLERTKAPLTQEPARPGLFVLCRDLAQAEAALDAGADGVVLDFLELTGTGEALRKLRARAASAGTTVHITLTPPRVLKPGEEKIVSYLESLAPDAMLVRGLGGLIDPANGPQKIGDFSLNVTNRVSAREVLSHGLAAFTPAFDLDSAQLVTLLDGELARFAEVVVHHPMPLFYTEHCVFAALLSEGRDHKTCGRPCDRHALSLRDRAGMEHPVIADVGCRNTVFHARAQSAADLVPKLSSLGVRRFRIELVRETAEDTTRIVRAYRDLFAGRIEAKDVFRALRSEGGYGVVRGSLRVLANP
jgi:putative protease